MKRLFSILMLLVAVGAWCEAEACTAALVLAKKSSEGAPTLWKHRDSPDWDCHYEYIQGKKYAYTALVSQDRKKTYCGINEMGFAILNTVSENLKPDLTITTKGIAITSMGNALAVCATVDEFEELLRQTNGKRRYVTNYACGDPSGALAFFEVWSEGYKRYDVEKQESGFDVRSNFSFAGDMVTPGPSVPRYDIVMRHMKGKKQYTPHDFIDYARNFENGAGVDVMKAPAPFVCNDLTVPRFFSVADMVAICDKENPRMVVVIGHPTSCMAVPVYVKAKNAIPQCAGGNGGRTTLELSEEVRAKVYHQIDELKFEVNKPLVNALLKVKTTTKMPKDMPKDIEKFNAKLDARFAKHAAKIRKVLAKF